MFKDKTVVITGGNGFIGRNLYSKLFPSAVVVSVSRTKVCRRGLISLVGDLETTPLDEILTNWGISPDYIIHLASVVGGIHYLKQHQAHTLQKNLAILGNSFRNIEKYPKLKGQVFLSSVCAYPQELQTSTSLDSIVLSEDLCNTYNPDSSYGWSKIMGEMLIQHYFKEFGVPGMSIRLFNTYGPYESLDTANTHVIPALLMKALKYPEEPFEVLGDGSQVRAFLYVDDAVDAILKALVTVQDGSVVNIGDTRPYTIKEVVDEVISVSKKKISPIFKPNSSVGAKGRLPDTLRAYNMLGWEPRKNLSDGLSKTYKWIKDQFK